MPIKSRCGSCGANFQAKDTLAGKRVKCPKCAQPIIIGTGNPATGPKTGAAPKRPAQSAAGAGAYNPLLDLLDEVKVKSAIRGPTCPNCSAEMKAGAIICVACGYNVDTGKQLKTSAFGDIDDGIADVGMTDADSIMSKAERDIVDMPTGSEGQDFGDGADSFLIAGVAGVILLILVGIGLGVILTMETITQHVASWFVSLLASMILGVCMAIWITVVAFLQKPGHGIACLLTGGLWCVAFGFMQGKQLLVPTAVLTVALIIGGASGAMTYYNGWQPAQNTSGR